MDREARRSLFDRLFDTTAILRNFPPTVHDIDGKLVDVDELAQRHVLIIITIKAPSCPVCPQLLMILNLHGLQDDPPETYRDPFDKSIMRVPPEELMINRILLRRDAFFIIICPGPTEDVQEIRRQVGFADLPYHFVVDENLSLATEIGFRMSNSEIWPAILMIEPKTRKARPVIFGRGPGAYGERDLLAFLREYRSTIESRARKHLRFAHDYAALLAKTGLAHMKEPEQSPEKAGIKSSASRPKPSSEGTTSTKLPPEIWIQVFSFLSSIEIVKKPMATSRHWRTIGIEVLLMRLRGDCKLVEDVMGGATEGLLQISASCGAEDASTESVISAADRVVGVRKLEHHIQSLHQLMTIAQRLLS